MKISAELKFDNIDNAVEMIRCFLTDFNQKKGSMLEVVDGDIVKLECFWKESDFPKETVNAIKGASKINKLICGDIENNSTSTILSTPPHTDEKKKIEQVEELPEIPEFAEIAKNATDFDTYVNNIIEFFDLQKSKKVDVIKNILNAAKSIEKISWPNIEEVMDTEFNTYDKIWLSKSISPKLNELGYNIAPLEVIKIIVGYKNLILNNSEKSNNVEQEELIIPRLNEILENIDKTKTDEEIAKDIVDEMGIDEEDYRVGLRIIEVINAILKMESTQLTWDEIFELANIQKEDYLKVRMEISTFINNFAKSSGYNKEIKALEFLSFIRENT